MYCDTLRISDVTVHLTAPSYLEVNESNGYVKLCVEAQFPTQSAYGINIRTMDDTATGKNDFVHACLSCNCNSESS